MKKTAVVYGSVYGSTKQYAQWIADSLSADLYENKNLDLSVLEPYNDFLLSPQRLDGLFPVQQKTPGYDVDDEKNALQEKTGGPNRGGPGNS